MNEKNTDFERTFDEYHELFRRELGKDSDLDDRVSKCEHIVFLMDALCFERFSDDYRKKSLEIQGWLKDGYFFDPPQKIDSNRRSIGHNNNVTKQRRLTVLRNWMSLILKENARFSLQDNLNRVDFRV